MKGEYIESLNAISADLIISANDYKVRFYFKGPDYRYNGSFFYIHSHEVDNFIESLRNNWKKYTELKSINLPGDFKLIGEMEMNIVSSKYFNGVSISEYNCFLSTEESVDSFIKDLEYVKERSKYLITFLSSIKDL